MNAEQLTRIELCNSCTCITYDDQDNEIESCECFGCYQDELAYLKGELAEWLKANKWTDETIIRVSFSGISWQRIAGQADITVEDIPEFLHLNGEFRIVFTLTADYLTLTACRYSHDEQTGTGLITFTESPFTRCDYCGDPSECLNINNEKVCSHCKEWKGIE
jgi:hypothetical protein